MRRHPPHQVSVRRLCGACLLCQPLRRLGVHPSLSLRLRQSLRLSCRQLDHGTTTIRCTMVSSATTAASETSKEPGTSACSAQVSTVSIFLGVPHLTLFTDYDWCSACMASPKAWEAHSTSHSFFPIHKKEDFLHFCLVKDRRSRRQPVHLDITCNGCNEKNLTGVRHKCLQCAGMDHCFSRIVHAF